MVQIYALILHARVALIQKHMPKSVRNAGIKSCLWPLILP